ncbi:MAG: methyltransferase domain-containing protein [Asgard group archaeon]|nr:methyltransferase domain-containing protein [Asgard group archaeon]
MLNYPHFFHLSGVHSKLPSYEIISILESKSQTFQIIEQRKQCLILNCSIEGALIASKRAGYCKRAATILFRGKSDDLSTTQIAQQISKNVDFKNHISKNETFLVRVYYIGDVKLKSVELENIIGKEIWVQLEKKNKVRMKNPDKTFIVMLIDNEFLFGLQLFDQKKGSFVNRRPDIRPYFKPGTLDPRFARLMVNLSLASEHKYLLDPFCGPGGILLEGTLMNCKAIGMDIDKRMIVGASKNLRHFTPNADFELLIGDARNLPFYNTIDSISTDPPYGRSTSTHGREIKNLLKQFFEQANQALKRDGYLAIGMFEEMPLQEVANEFNFEVKVYEKLYIHKSLTRKVGVFQKK